MEVEGINVFYGEVQVLFDVSITVSQGELAAIVGPNGSGKTTLLRTIQGLLHPATGEVRFHGQRIDRYPANQLVGLGLASIPEGRHLFPEMSVRENLELGAYTPRARANTAATLELVLAMFPVLRERAQEQAGRLSGGEQQMLAIARGLMSRPQLLLLDDPFAGLAHNVSARFCETLQMINDDGLTILVAGQHVRRLLTIASRAYLIEAGRITMEGTGRAMLESERLRRALLAASITSLTRRP